MGRPYSQDLRDRVMGAVDRGMRAYRAAEVFAVSVSYIYKALGRRRATGETTARLLGRGPKPKLAGHEEALRQKIKQTPDATLAELQVWLLDERGIKVSQGCLWTRLDRLGLTFKKSRCVRASRIVRTSPRGDANGSLAKAI